MGAFYGSPTYIVYDNFIITSETIISQIDWFGGERDTGSYTGTEYFIYNGLPESSTLIANDSVIASRINTGLISGIDQTVYDYSISGLSISLAPGTYYLGLSTSGFGGNISIGRSDNTPLPNGLYQNAGGILNGPFMDDMYFKLSATVVPIPAAIWLFGTGLIGLIGVARRKKA